VRALQRLGFAVIRQRGSHIVMRRDSSGCIVPNHRELKTGTLAGLVNTPLIMLRMDKGLHSLATKALRG